MTAYYNDNDPFAARWLRNLIAAGELPAGTVDGRNMEEVSPDDVAGHDQAHFFAGIGGWPLALRLAGWPADRPVWSASCPCQPFSGAGRGQGAADARHVWPAFYVHVAELRPAVVFGEQVASPLGREWFAGVRADLEGLGYAVGGAGLPAASVGAPHLRERLFWVAHADGDDWGAAGRRSDAWADGRDEPRGGSASGRLAHTDDVDRGSRERGAGRHGAEVDHGGVMGDAEVDRVRTLVGESGPGPRSPQSPRGSGPPSRLADAERGAAERHGHEVAGAAGALQGEARERERIRSDGRDGRAVDSASAGGDLGDAAGARRARAEIAPTVDGSGRPGGRGCAAESERAGDRGEGSWSRADWVACADGVARRVEPGVHPLADGFPGRVGRLRAYGNAIVPQVAAQFVAAAMEAIGEY